MAIARHFVTIGSRQVHYRRAGDGPVLLMLHASLNTSATFLPLIGPLADDYTVIAMDTPGYGLSDVLGSEPPEIEDYADGVIEFMDALGLQRVALYGMLTGAMIGVDLATRYPQRFAAVILNTMLVHTDAELKEFVDKFTPPMPERWDGLHLVQAWDLMRRNAIAYPWFEPGPETRFNLPMPSPDELHLRLMNCLSAGAHYSWGAKAAFRFLRRASIVDMAVPTVFFSDRSQPFGAHGDRLAPLPEGGRVHRFDDWDRLPAEITAVLKGLPVAEPAPAAPSAVPIAGTFTSRCVGGETEQIHVRQCREGHGRPVLLLHGAGGEARLMERYAHSLLGQRPVIAMDLPGHGESSPWPEDANPIAAVTHRIQLALSELEVEAADVFAVECGAAVAFALAERNPEQIRFIAWNEVLYPDASELPAWRDNYCPDIEPDHHGGYLLQAWGFLRDQDLYSPWFDKRAANIVWDSPARTLERQTLRAVALLKAIPALSAIYSLGFDARWRGILEDGAVNARMCTFAKDPSAGQARAVARVLGHAATPLSQDESDWVAQALI